MSYGYYRDYEDEMYDDDVYLDDYDDDFDNDYDDDFVDDYRYVDSESDYWDEF